MSEGCTKVSTSEMGDLLVKALGEAEKAFRKL